MKKIGLVFLALVVALGSLGAAYAMWSDKITVDTNISTGTVCIDISGQRVMDHYAPPPYYPTDTPDYTCNPGFVSDPVKGDFWELDKNVSWGECNIVDGNMFVTLYNTYPCNFNEIGAYVRNCGTIPVKIWKTQVLLPDGAGGWALLGEFDDTGEYFAFDINGDGAPDIEVTYGDNFGTQLEPGERAEISYWIHTLQASPEDATFSFQFKIFAVQYNEYAPLP